MDPSSFSWAVAMCGTEGGKEEEEKEDVEEEEEEEEKERIENSCMEGRRRKIRQCN